MQETSKIHFSNESIILKFTNHVYNFIKQQCQATRLRRANHPLSVKSELGTAGFHMVDFARCLLELEVLNNYRRSHCIHLIKKDSNMPGL